MLPAAGLPPSSLSMAGLLPNPPVFIGSPISSTSLFLRQSPPLWLPCPAVRPYPSPGPRAPLPGTLPAPCPSCRLAAGKASAPVPCIITLSDTPIVSNPLHMLITVGEAPFFTSDISCGALMRILPALNPIPSFARSVSFRWLTASAPVASSSPKRSGRCRSWNPAFSGVRKSRFPSFVVR